MPWYVVGKDSREDRTPCTSRSGADHPALFTTSAAITRCFWVSRGTTARHGHGSRRKTFGADEVRCPGGVVHCEDYGHALEDEHVGTERVLHAARS